MPKRARKHFCFLRDWCAPVISLTKESTVEHVLAKALLPKAALLDWSAPGLKFIVVYNKENLERQETNKQIWKGDRAALT